MEVGGHWVKLPSNRKWCKRSKLISIFDSLASYWMIRLNTNRIRSNFKLIGIPESDGPESWFDSQEIFADNVNAELHIKDYLQIERAHRVGPKRKDSTFVHQYIQYVHSDLLL